MKKFIICMIVFFLINLSYTNAKSCQNVVGAYRIIPFAQPLGLNNLSAAFISQKPFGSPILQIIKNPNDTQKLQLIYEDILALAPGKHVYNITINPVTKQNTTYIDMLFNAHISNCSLQLDKNVHIIQVDLNHLSKEHLNQGMENLRKLWERFTYADQSTPMSDKPVQQYKLDFKSLSKIKYFLTFHFFMVGTTEAIFIVPLEQLSDTTQLTAHPHSLTEIK